MNALTDFDLPTLARLLEQHGLRPIQARRLLRGFYDDPDGFTPSVRLHGAGVVALVDRLLKVRQSRVIHERISADGTRKLLVGLDGGDAVEAVLMPAHRPGLAAGCISSQVGCAMRCDFCASTQEGLVRDLSAGEIVEQFLRLRSAAGRIGRRLRTLVFMGMGEPMHNLDAVMDAIGRIADPVLGNFGAKRITVSTVGIVPGIDRLAQAGLGVHLALSLHAPDDATRGRLVPMNRRYPVAEIMAAARRFGDRTGRPVNIEYCLLRDVNDSTAHATGLADLMAGFAAHVNIIPYNPIGTGLSGIAHQRPTDERVAAFVGALRERGVVTHVRIARGDDVNAACGQLRRAVSAQTDRA